MIHLFCKHLLTLFVPHPHDVSHSNGAQKNCRVETEAVWHLRFHPHQNQQLRLQDQVSEGCSCMSKMRLDFFLSLHDASPQQHWTSPSHTLTKHKRRQLQLLWRCRHCQRGCATPWVWFLKYRKSTSKLGKNTANNKVFQGSALVKCEICKLWTGKDWQRSFSMPGRRLR